jgi:hypothetical protein
MQLIDLRVAGIFIFSITIMLGFKFYKRIREKTVISDLVFSIQL